MTRKISAIILLSMISMMSVSKAQSAIAIPLDKEPKEHALKEYVAFECSRYDRFGLRKDAQNIHIGATITCLVENASLRVRNF
jgi:hypothetical protein